MGKMLQDCTSSHRLPPHILQQLTTDGSSDIPTDLTASARDTALAKCVYQYAGPPRYYFVLILSLIPAAAQGVSVGSFT